MSVEEKNKDLMKTLDDGWNSQDWDTFEERHAENVAIFWPGQPNPTRGVRNHRAESIEFFKAFPDNHIVNNPYKILFANGDYTCSVADFTGTFKGPIKGLTGKSFSLLTGNSKQSFVPLRHGKMERLQKRGYSMI
jgi:hypothetical protein